MDNPAFGNYQVFSAHAVKHNAVFSARFDNRLRIIQNLGKLQLAR